MKGRSVRYVLILALSLALLTALRTAETLPGPGRACLGHKS